MTAPTSRRPGPASPRSSLRRDAGLVAVGQLAAVVSGFLLTLFGARTLPPDEFSALSWGLAWLGYLAVLAQFGLTRVATIAFAGPGAPEQVRTLRHLLVAQTVGAVAVVAVWWAGIGPLAAGAGTPPEVYRPLVPVIALWLPAAAFGPVVVNALRARGRFGLALTFGEHVRRVVLIGLLLALAAAVTWLPSLEAVLWWAVAIETGAYLVGVLVLRRALGDAPARSGEPAESPWRMLRGGSAFVLATLAAVTVPQAGVWLLAAIAPVEEVALFSVAVRIALLVAVPVAIGLRTLAPRFAAASAAGRLASLEEPVRRFAVWSTVAIGVAVVGLAVTGPVVVPAVFGALYADAVVPALVMCVGVLANAWTGPCAGVLSHTGHERTVAVSALVSSAAFFACGAWWGSEWGATGVAAAAAVAMSGHNLRLARVARRRTGIRTTARPARRGT
ncbi:lipopolysaccharide biosynthesis protein [Geodermatophilus sp. SYSU D00708]